MRRDVISLYSCNKPHFCIYREFVFLPEKRKHDKLSQNICPSFLQFFIKASQSWHHPRQIFWFPKPLTSPLFVFFLYQFFFSVKHRNNLYFSVIVYSILFRTKCFAVTSKILVVFFHCFWRESHYFFSLELKNLQY